LWFLILRFLILWVLKAVGICVVFRLRFVEDYVFWWERRILNRCCLLVVFSSVMTGKCFTRCCFSFKKVVNWRLLNSLLFRWASITFRRRCISLLLRLFLLPIILIIGPNRIRRWCFSFRQRGIDLRRLLSINSIFRISRCLLTIVSSTNRLLALCIWIKWFLILTSWILTLILESGLFGSSYVLFS